MLLDFWTSGCGNCLHVIAELRPLERKYEDVLTVVGVHSPKFAHEADPSSVRAAVERYEVGHPVLSDPTLHLWRQYAVRAWPTLVLVDPEGYVVVQAAGEGHVSGLDAVLAQLVPTYEARGTLRRGTDTYFMPADDTASALRFPAKAALAGDTLLVADAGHHQVVELDRDAHTVLRRSGADRGEPFTEPNGVAVLPDGDVVVADTGAHVLRVLRRNDLAVARTVDLPRLLAGARTVTGPVPDVLSPWDVVWWPALAKAVVAAAGVHLLLSWDPGDDTVAVLAGTTVEGVKDGPALDGWLAQPSGLAVDGDRLWFVDTESSTLRYLTVDGELHTVVGEGLFDFGHVDGPAGTARLQHPLGLAVLPDGSVAVADTYNGAVRRYADGVVTTLATGLAEPSDVLVVDGELVVVESAAHRLVRPVPGIESRDGGEQHTPRPVTRLSAGGVTLNVAFTPPPGRVLDDRDGPGTRLSVTASPPQLLLDGAGDGTGLVRELRLAPGSGVLSVTAQAAACDDDPGTEHPACYLSRQDWSVPVDIGAGAGELELVLMDG